MNHAEVHSLMGEYLDGDLKLGKRALFDVHLETCERCSREYSELRDTVSLLRQLPDPEMPPMFTEDVMRRIRNGEGQTRALDRVREWLGAIFAPSVATPAAALALGLMMATGNLDLSNLSIPWLSLDAESPGFANNLSPHLDPSLDPQNPQFGLGTALAKRGLVRSPSGLEGLAFNLEPAPTRTVGHGVAVLSAGSPPAVARAQHVTIRIPFDATRFAVPRSGPATPQRVVTRWAPRPNIDAGRGFGSRPVLSTNAPNTRGLPTNAGSLARNVSGGLVPAAGRARAADSAFTPLGAGLERERQRVAELEARLAYMIESPALFSAEFVSLSIAEQEIWLEELAEYAQQVDRGDQAVTRLRGARDPRALQLATALAAELRQVEGSQRASLESAR